MATTIGAARTNFNVFEEALTDANGVPTTTETVTTETVWVEELVLSGTGTAATVTVTDGQGTVVPLVKDVSLAAGEIYQKDLGSRKMPSGIKWTASAAGVIGFIRYKR